MSEGGKIKRDGRSIIDNKGGQTRYREIEGERKTFEFDRIE